MLKEPISVCTHSQFVLCCGIDLFFWYANHTLTHCAHCWLRSNPQRVFPWEWVCQITHCCATKHLCAALIRWSTVLTQPLGPRLSLCSSLRGYNPDSDTLHTGQGGDRRITGNLLIHRQPKANTAAATGGWCWQLEQCVREEETVTVKVIRVRYTYISTCAEVQEA